MSLRIASHTAEAQVSPRRPTRLDLPTPYPAGRPTRLTQPAEPTQTKEADANKPTQPDQTTNPTSLTRQRGPIRSVRPDNLDQPDRFKPILLAQTDQPDPPPQPIRPNRADQTDPINLISLKELHG